ncbi:uncharacterized protein LOC126844767 [Adelges cooleyi]|uniref:uncharacterized protein LOC126844767 n=1 Tax=Adelges cooleyi TaxID=133065 RepID=UPI00217F797E|nr:uncharacterized protein LOC126844767 [Adelges cooleyi]
MNYMMMDNGLLSYTDCCNKLERIASRRRIYGSGCKSSKKDSKQNQLTDQDVKNVFSKIPFVCTGSPSKSYHIGLNIQTALSMVKQFRERRFDADQEWTESNNFLTESKLFNKNNNGACGSQFSDSQPYCPAMSEYGTDSQDEDQTYDGTPRDPWAVRQTDADDDKSNCAHNKSSCNCSTRFMDSYQQVMGPYIKQHFKRKQKSLDKVNNPYVKEKTVQHFETLSQRIQELKLTMMSMTAECVTLTKKYSKLYEQYSRNRDDRLVPKLLEIEDELTRLKTKVEEAVDMYKEAAIFINVQAPDEATSSYELTLDDNEIIPKETNVTRLTRLMRRIQNFQEKLKTGCFCKKIIEST